MATENPRSFNKRPIDAAVKPLPTELITPPVKNMNFGCTAFFILTLLLKIKGGLYMAPSRLVVS
jgi:hypothetical protein